MGLAWAVGRGREVPGEEGISPEVIPRGAFREWGESPGRPLGGDGGVPGLRESVLCVQVPACVCVCVVNSLSASGLRTNLCCQGTQVALSVKVMISRS